MSRCQLELSKTTRVLVALPSYRTTGDNNLGANNKPSFSAKGTDSEYHQSSMYMKLENGLSIFNHPFMKKTRF